MVTIRFSSNDNKTLRKKQKTILAILPGIYGYSGDVINEMNLLSSICRKVDFCYLFTTLSPFQIIKFRKSKPKIPKNTRIFIFITPPRPNFLLSIVYRLIFSYIFVLIISATGLSRKLSLIYIRDSAFATAFLTVKSLANKTIVKIPSILETENTCRGLAKNLANKLIDFTERLVFARAKKVAVHSVYQAIELIKRRRYRRKNCFVVVPPGVRSDKIKKIKLNSQVARTQGADDSSYCKIGYVGTLTYRQGVDLLAEAATLVKKMDPNVKLIIIGDGPLKNKVEYICKKGDLKYEITGFIPHELALNKMSELDILVVPRRRNPVTETIIPIKVIEAWALGVPVIVTRHKAFTLQFKDYEDIVYCEPDPFDIASKILELMNDKHLKNKLKIRGPELAEKYNYDSIAEKLLKLSDAITY